MYEIFEQLMKEKGLKQTDVSKATGISNSIITDWKKGRYTPKQDKRQKIADFFGVTLEYLDNWNFSENRNSKYEKFFDAISNDPEFMENIQILFSLPDERREPIYDLIRSQNERFRKKDARHNTNSSQTA